jgi:hypothetical protein
MDKKIVLATAYLPPAEYFSHIQKANYILIEKCENYVKQTYRNRCYIISANGLQQLIVPVHQGSFHKTALRDIKIDYSRRWQQVHIRALNASYRSSPFWPFYSDEIERIILKNHVFLIDLNMELTRSVMEFLTLDRKIDFTDIFEHSPSDKEDLRYIVSPKKPSSWEPKKYTTVFDHPAAKSPGISIIDLVFNLGPEAAGYL